MTLAEVEGQHRALKQPIAVIPFNDFIINLYIQMAKQGGITYLGLCGRLEPPLIGVYYKSREKDGKKKVYTILLQRLVLNPNVDEVVDQLYREHPTILRQDKIPKQKIANLFSKIQAELHMAEDEYDDEQFQESEGVAKKEKRMPLQNFNYQDDQEENEA